MRLFSFLVCVLSAVSVSSSFAGNIKEVVKTTAVSVSYRGPASAYKYAHRACQKQWKRDIQNIVSERPTFSVEIVAINSKPKTVSALCVSRKYVNDDVRNVAIRK